MSMDLKLFEWIKANRDRLNISEIIEKLKKEGGFAMKRNLIFLGIVFFIGIVFVNLSFGAKNLFEKNANRIFSDFTFAAVAPNGKYAVEAFKNGGKQTIKIEIKIEVEVGEEKVAEIAMADGLIFENEEDLKLYKDIEVLWFPYKITFILPYENTEFEGKIDEIKENDFVKVDTRRKIITSEVQAHIRERIYSVVFSQDSKRLASAGWFDSNSLLKIGKDEEGKEVLIKPEYYEPQDVPIRIWGVNLVNQRLFLIKELKGQKSGVEYLAFSADGNRLASFGYEHIITWDVESGDIISKIESPKKYAYSMDLSHDGKTIAVGEKKGNLIHIYNVDTGEEIKGLKGYTKKGINSIAFSPDSRYLASAGRLKKDNTVLIWDTNEWSSTITQSWHKKSILTLSFSPDNKYLASGDEKNNICVWDVESGKLLEVFKKDIVGSLDSEIHFLETGELMYYDGKNVKINKIKCKFIQ